MLLSTARILQHKHERDETVAAAVHRRRSVHQTERCMQRQLATELKAVCRSLGLHVAVDAWDKQSTEHWVFVHAHTWGFTRRYIMAARSCDDGIIAVIDLCGCAEYSRDERREELLFSEIATAVPTMELIIASHL